MNELKWKESGGGYDKMKVLVTGAKGQLGTDVINELAKRGHVAIGVGVADMDITDSAAVLRDMTESEPEASAA